MKRFSILLAAILCAFSCAACGAPKTDSSSASQESAVSQPESTSTEQESAVSETESTVAEQESTAESEDITESLEVANLCAKAVFTATEKYWEKCMNNNIKLPDGELTDIKIDAANEDYVVKPPSGGYAALEDAAADIQKAVSVYMCDYVGTEGTFFSIKIENGFLKCTVWSEEPDSHIVGGYPNPATDTGWTLEKAGQSGL